LVATASQAERLLPMTDTEGVFEQYSPTTEGDILECTKKISTPFHILLVLLCRKNFISVMELQIIKNAIRGHKVMTDFDLAEFYQVKTKYLKRNIEFNLFKK
jgi:hypothetical protein